jgi:hypothetical protein
MSVGSKRCLLARERTDEHQQRRLRQVEIRHHRVDDPKFEPGVDEQAAVAGERRERAAARGRLERTHAGRADGHDAPARGAATRDCFAGRRRHLQPFRMQLVILDALRSNGRESTRADVQRQKRVLDAELRERSELRTIEMQTCGRRGHGARRARIHGLVAFAIRLARDARDVRRQRHLAVGFEKRHDVAVELELKQRAVAPDHARARFAGQLELAARLRLVTGLELEERAPGAEQALEQQLDAPAARLLRLQPGRQHARIVQHEQIAASEQRWQVREHPVT